MPNKPLIGLGAPTRRKTKQKTRLQKSAKSNAQIRAVREKNLEKARRVRKKNLTDQKKKAKKKSASG